MNLTHFAWKSLTLSLMLAGLTGCVTTTKKKDPAADGRAIFNNMQAAVMAATKSVAPSVAYVVIQNAESSGGRTITIGGQSFSTGDRNRSKTYTGLVLDPDGHLLVATPLKADEIALATAWINEEEYVAHLVTVDEGLGMSLLKIEPEAPLKAIDFERFGTLSPGAWSVALTPSGEDRDFARTQDVGFCSGLEEGQFTTYIINGSRLISGAPIMNINGKLSGVAISSSRAVAMTDAAEPLQELLARAHGKLAGEEGEGEESDKGWLGIMHAPINADFARKHDLPRGGIHINNVSAGSPAAEAGLQSGDLIVKVNGKDVRFSGTKAADHFKKILRARIGKPFEMHVVRGKIQKTVNGTFAEPPKPDSFRAKDIGIDVRGIDASLIASENLFADVGVYINEIEKGSPAAMSGNRGSSLLDKGDVITAIAGTATPDLAAFSSAIEKLREDKPPVVLVAYTRGRVTGYAALNLGLGEKQ